MRTTILLSLILLVSTKLSANVIVEYENTKANCEKVSDEIFHCNSGDKKILLVKNFSGYSAFEKNANEMPKPKMVNKLETDGKILFETPKFPGSYGGDSSLSFANRPATRADKIMDANIVTSNLSDIKDPWASEFVVFAKNFIKTQSVFRQPIKIKDYNGESFECTPGHTRELSKEEQDFEKRYNSKLACNNYACVDNKGQQVLAYIPPLGSLGSAHYIKFNSEQTDLRFDGFKVVDSDNSEDLPLYDHPKITPYAGFKPDFDQKLLTPKKYQKNQNAFINFTSPQYEYEMKAEENLCIGDNKVQKLISEKNKVVEIMKTDLATMELAQYLTLINGQMVSMVIDAAKSKDIGCRYGSFILSPSAAAHLNFLQRVKPKPIAKYLSVREVQDLYKKAKDMSDIPFGFKYDGCYARAHVMARRFEEMGVPTEKAWIKGDLFVPNTDIAWNYHVAPVVNVKDLKGKIVKYVIDPSLNNKAVTLDEWVDSMGKRVKGGVIKTQYPFPQNAANFQRTAVAISSSDVYLPDNDENKTEEENMEMAIQTMQEYSNVLKEGKI